MFIALFGFIIVGILCWFGMVPVQAVLLTVDVLFWVYLAVGIIMLMTMAVAYFAVPNSNAKAVSIIAVPVLMILTILNMAWTYIVYHAIPPDATTLALIDEKNFFTSSSIFLVSWGIWYLGTLVEKQLAKDQG